MKRRIIAIVAITSVFFSQSIAQKLETQKPDSTNRIANKLNETFQNNKNTTGENTMYQVNVISRLEGKLVAFILHTTFVENRQSKEIPPFFHKIMEENSLESVSNRINKNQICLFDKKADSPMFDYYMGVEVDETTNIPSNMQCITIPASKYAVTSFVKKGNMDVLQAIKYLTEKWIPENNYKQEINLPVFVNYDEKFVSIYKSQGYEGNPVAELFIPIK